MYVEVQAAGGHKQGPVAQIVHNIRQNLKEDFKTTIAKTCFTQHYQSMK
jgi:hypothetical protein